MGKKPYNRGFCLGKFMPFHKGHQLMIDHAKASCTEVQVIITGSEDEPIPLSVRAGWLREHYEHDNVEIIDLVDHIGKTELDEHGTAIDEGFWQAWLELINANTDPIDAVFTNDAYGERLAKELGADWMPLDTGRDQFNVSGTSIRENPWKHGYQYLPDVVKPYYQRKVAVIGPESTGKSTLVRHLARAYNMAKVPEYGRTLSELKNNDLDANDFRAIIAGQKSLVRAAEDSYQNIVCDTESFTTHMFSKIYLTPRDQELEEELLKEARGDDFDLYILLEPFKEWTDDGTRILPDYAVRLAFYTDLLDYLIQHKRNFVIIEAKMDEYYDTPNWYQRSQDARIAVQNMFDKVRIA